MKRLRLDRLRRMSPHEWRWRTRDALHTAAERVGTRTGASRWKRKDIGGVLATDALGMAPDASGLVDHKRIGDAWEHAAGNYSIVGALFDQLRT